MDSGDIFWNLYDKVESEERKKEEKEERDLWHYDQLFELWKYYEFEVQQQKAKRIPWSKDQIWKFKKFSDVDLYQSETFYYVYEVGESDSIELPEFVVFEFHEPSCNANASVYRRDPDTKELEHVCDLDPLE